MPDWTDYDQHCEDLKKLRTQQAKITSQAANAAKKAKEYIVKKFGTDKEYISLEKKIADKLFELQEWLQTNLNEEIKDGPSNDNLIDTEQFLTFRSDKSRVQRHINDHIRTLKIERNSIITRQLNLAPYLTAMLGAGIKVAGGAVLAALAFGSTYYLLFQ